MHLFPLWLPFRSILYFAERGARAVFYNHVVMCPQFKYYHSPLFSTEILCEVFSCLITIKLDKYFYRNMIIISLSFNDTKCYLLITFQVCKNNYFQDIFKQPFIQPLTLNLSISNQDISVGTDFEPDIRFPGNSENIFVQFSHWFYC